MAAAGLVAAAAIQAWSGPPGSGVSGRLLGTDPIGVTIALLVSFVGWIVMRYSRRYLDGEAREGAFHALMLLTLASVLVLVLAPGFAVLIPAFVAVGLCLRKLLLFYPDRAEARRAAAKFTLVWSAGDVALIAGRGSSGGLWHARASGSLATRGRGCLRPGMSPSALLILAACSRRPSFPLHGWLTEVMEAPTPVSALLHAGIINSGGVILIRMSELAQSSPGAMAALAMMGGLTALFGAVVMLTQSAVKTALAWSTISQMGFMLLQCGLGPLGAGAFACRCTFALQGARLPRLRRRDPRSGRSPPPGTGGRSDLGAVARAFAIAIVLYGVVAAGFGALIGPKTPQALALGAILIFGVAYLVAQGLADAAPAALTRRTALASLGPRLRISASSSSADAIWGAHLPVPPGSRCAGVGADPAGAFLVRRRRGGAGALPALGPSPGHRRAEGSPRERPLPQHAPRPPDRRVAERDAQLTEGRHMFLKHPQIEPARISDLLRAAEAAARAVPPAFPLDATVAVNPFLGQTDEDLATASARLARVGGGRLTRPRAEYAAQVAQGNIPDDALAAALIESTSPLKPVDLAYLKARIHATASARGFADRCPDRGAQDRNRLARRHRAQRRTLGGQSFRPRSGALDPAARARGLRRLAGMGDP